MAVNSRKRPHLSDSKSVAQPRKRQANTKPLVARDVVTESTSHESPAASFRTPNNPQATLSGLPAELRLEIYSYLCDSTIIHVHHHTDRGTSRFTWTPCRTPSAASPLLCANPKWSGMCDEEDRCTYKIYAPPEPCGFWALAASNKSIRNEMQEFFLRRTVVSIHPQDFQPWLHHLARHSPRQIANVRRLTLAGPNSHIYVRSAELRRVRDQMPNLEGIGFQCQDSIWRWVRSYANNDAEVDDEAWKRWYLMDWMRGFDDSVTIAMEAMVWRKATSRGNLNITEQQIAIRIIREGKPAEGGSGAGSSWTDDDVKVEIEKPGKLVAYKRNAKWRQWWRGKEVKGLA